MLAALRLNFCVALALSFVGWLRAESCNATCRQPKCEDMRDAVPEFAFNPLDPLLVVRTHPVFRKFHVQSRPFDPRFIFEAFGVKTFYHYDCSVVRPDLSSDSSEVHEHYDAMNYRKVTCRVRATARVLSAAAARPTGLPMRSMRHRVLYSVPDVCHMCMCAFCTRRSTMCDLRRARLWNAMRNKSWCPLAAWHVCNTKHASACPRHSDQHVCKVPTPSPHPALPTTLERARVQAYTHAPSSSPSLPPVFPPIYPPPLFLTRVLSPCG